MSSETPWVIQARTRWRVGRGRGEAASRSMRVMAWCHARCSASPKMETTVRWGGGGGAGSWMPADCPDLPVAAVQMGAGSIEPGSIEPGSIEPGSIEPGSIEPGSIEPGSIEVAARCCPLLPGSKRASANRCRSVVPGSMASAARCCPALPGSKWASPGQQLGHLGPQVGSTGLYSCWGHTEYARGAVPYRVDVAVGSGGEGAEYDAATTGGAGEFIVVPRRGRLEGHPPPLAAGAAVSRGFLAAGAWRWPSDFGAVRRRGCCDRHSAFVWLPWPSM